MCLFLFQVILSRILFQGSFLRFSFLQVPVSQALFSDFFFHRFLLPGFLSPFFLSTGFHFPDFFLWFLFPQDSLFPAFSRFFSLKPRLFSQSFLSSPQKKRATVPGPVWLPIVVPMSLISTLPFSFGNRSSTRRATSRASSIQADWEI